MATTVMAAQHAQQPQPTPRMAHALSRVVPDVDLLHDISVTCAEAGITSTGLAAGQHGAGEVAQRLFLTESEAAALIEECKKSAVADADAPPPPLLLELVPEGEEDDTSATAVAMPVKAGKALARDLALPRTTEPHEIAVRLVVDAKPPAAAAATEAEPAEVPAAAEAAAPVAVEPAPVVKRGSPLRASWSGLSPPAPSDEPAVPSYLRPTATHQARTSKALVAETIKEDAAAQPSPAKKKSNKYSNVLARVFAPTATFLARITGKGPGANKPLGATTRSEVLRQSMVDRILQSPQGQRTTPAQPFSPHLSRPKAGPAPDALTSEEEALVEAQKHAFKRNPVPKHIHENRPLGGVHMASIPKSPEAVFQPFQLASQERHSVERARRAVELAEQQRSEDSKRAFRALKFDKSVVTQVDSPSKVEPKPTTVPQAPQLSVAQRGEVHKESALAKWARLPAAEKKKLEERKREIEEEEALRTAQQVKDREERKKQEALEKLSIEELRRSMVFKARAKPSFADTFRPDLSKAAKVTQSLDFSFRTDDRFGKPLTPAERGAVDGSGGIGLGRYDGLGYADPFASSLRGSATFASFARGGAKGASLARSMQGPLSPAAAASLLRSSGALGGGRGGLALRASVSSPSSPAVQQRGGAAGSVRGRGGSEVSRSQEWGKGASCSPAAAKGRSPLSKP